MASAILERLAPRYDALVQSIYRAGSGLEPWLNPIGQMAEAFDAWAVQLLGVNKRTGTMSFSFEGGVAPPEAGVEYIRYYHRIDPRLGKHLPAPVGDWFSCEDHFDDGFVEKDRFYQEYLVAYGGRYLHGGKLHDDENHTVLIGHLGKLGNPPMCPEEKAAFQRVSDHVRKALDIQAELAKKAERQSVGAELLEKMRQPMVLLDDRRRITYRNRSASQLLARNDPVYEMDGQLVCRNADSDLDLTLALRALALVPAYEHGVDFTPSDRRSFRLRRMVGRSVAATLLALRPEATLGSFGRTPQALFTLFEPGAPVDVDPFLLSATFDLTPAEARLAAKIVNGRSPEQCSQELKVKISTVRSQLVSIYSKTGATGQADLVRLILSATTL